MQNQKHHVTEIPRIIKRSIEVKAGNEEKEKRITQGVCI